MTCHKGCMLFTNFRIMTLGIVAFTLPIWKHIQGRICGFLVIASSILMDISKRTIGAKSIKCIMFESNNHVFHFDNCIKADRDDLQKIPTHNSVQGIPLTLSLLYHVIGLDCYLG
ncbi:hypothetical protein ACJX0J_014860, partial [Zea mays]